MPAAELIDSARAYARAPRPHGAELADVGAPAGPGARGVELYDVTLPGPTRPRVRAWARPDRVELVLEPTATGTAQTRAPLELCVHVAPRMGMTAAFEGARAGHEPAWHMLRALPNRGRVRRDAFVAFTADAFEHVFARPWAHHRWRAADRERARDVLRDVALLAGEASRAAVARCEPHACRAARRFRPSLRWDLYRAIVGDESGRLLQLSHVAPGALLFARALRDESDPLLREAGDALLAAVLAGQSLQRALAPAVALWVERVGTSVSRWRFERERGALAPRAAGAGAGAALADEPGPATRWTALSALAPVEQAQAAAAKRLLLRRTGATAGLAAIMEPPVRELVPEDIPHERHANARWHAVMHHHRAFLWGAPHEPAIAALARATSRAAGGRAVFDELWAWRGLIDRVRRERFVVPRTRDVLELARAANVGLPLQRRAAAAQLAAVQPALPGLGELPASLRFPCVGPEPPPELVRSIALTRIGTMGELRREAERMRHCVLSFAPVALGGLVALYRLEFDARPYTLALAYVRDVPIGPECPWLLDLRGRKNHRPPTALVRDHLAPWLRAHAVRITAWLADLAGPPGR